MEEKVMWISPYYDGALSGFREEIKSINSDILNNRLKQFEQMKNDFIVMENLLYSLSNNDELPENIRNNIIKTLKS